MSEYYKISDNTAQVKKSKARQPVGKRTTRRFQLNNTQIKLRKTGMLKFLQNANNQASLVNLSKNGMQLLITEMIKAEDNYQINLYVPGFLNPLIMKARVIWCKPHKKFFDKTYYRAGFEFVKLDHDVAHYLRRLEATC